MEKVQMVMSRPESGEWLGNADIMTYAGDAKGEGAGNRPWVTAPAARRPAASQLEAQGTV